MDAVLPAVFFVVVFAGAAWIVITHLRKQAARAAALDTLAAGQGWQVERKTEGRRHVTTLTPAQGGWVLRVAPPRSTGSSKNRNSIPGFTEFRADTPNWPGGRAIFSQRLPGGVSNLLGGAGLAGVLQGAAVKAMLNRLVGSEVMAEIGRLQPFDPPPGIELSILASDDPRDGNLRAIHDLIHGWKPRKTRDRTPPGVIIGPEGMTVRLPTELQEPGDIAAFADMGQRLARDLGGEAAGGA